MIADKKELFLQKLKNQFPGQYNQIVEAISKPFPLTFRINKTTADEISVLDNLKAQDFEIEKGPLENSFIVKSTPTDKKLSETQEFETGQVYIQKLSSMLPATILNPKPNEKILDLCAAPGSKTTQIADLADNRVQIVAVENNRARAFKLKENLKKYGFENVTVINENAVLLPKTHSDFINYFDKILVDAPCSNEGQITLTDPKSIQHWHSKLAKKISKLQKRLLSSAVQMLKPQGTIVYSTCTFSIEENEDVIKWTISKFPYIKLIKQARIFPDGQFTAFFYAMLQKTIE